MARRPPALKLALEQARCAMIAAQALPAAPDASVTAVLERSGFVRTLGGVDVYLALRARIPALRRRDLDAAAENGDVQVVPAVRGCMYLVPRAHVPLALRIADRLSRPRAEREQAAAGIRKGEVEEVARAAAEALDRGPLTTDQLRKALPGGLVRSLGEVGRKVGISSPLPPALRRLELDGVIERRVESGRLDSERYTWRRTARSPFDGASLPDDVVELTAQVAGLFFRAAGLGEVRELAAWAGVSVRDARAAVQRLPLLPVEVSGMDEPQLVLESERERLLENEGRDALALLPFEDNLVALHGGPAPLVDREHHGVPVPRWGSSKTPKTIGEARHMSMRCVVADGRIAGLWEYDPASGQIVTAPFGTLPALRRSGLEVAAQELADFFRDDLGHGRSFSLDTDEMLAGRVERLRSLAAGTA